MLNRVMWEGRLLPGKSEEYIERHDRIWPEMVENLKLQGIRNYSIFLSGDRVFGYYECEDLEKRDAVKAVNAEKMGGVHAGNRRSQSAASIPASILFGINTYKECSQKNNLGGQT